MRFSSAAMFFFTFVTASQVWAQPKIVLQPVFGEYMFDRPLALKQVPGEDGRFYVVEQPGRVLLLESLADDVPDVVLDMRGQVEDRPNEAGLLGLAFDPRFAETSRVFFVLHQAWGWRSRVRCRLGQYGVGRPIDRSGIRTNYSVGRTAFQ